MVGRKKRYRQSDGSYIYTHGEMEPMTKKASRQDYKLDKIEAKTEKAKAVATKRKWTALLLLLGLLAVGAVSLKGCLPI
tara:strand:+ start:3766 stop:4002 length:237 start_codon:yes stop_codon:yes gene_type:complete